MSYYNFSNFNNNALSTEFLNHYDSPYTCNNYEGVNYGYKIFEDKNPVPKHNIDKSTLSTQWWKSLCYHKNPVFFQHGGNKMYCYDFKQRRWEVLVNMTGQYFPRYHRITELPDASFLMHGGEVNGQSVSNSFHFIDGIFNPKNNMNYPRKAHGHIYVKGFVYVFGGFGQRGTINECEKYDMNNGGWSNIAPLNTSKAYTTCVKFSDDYIFIIGGYSNNTYSNRKELDTIERYDIKNNIYNEFKVKLPVPSYGFACAMISNDEVLICGGYSQQNNNSSNVYVADLAKAYIKTLNNLPCSGWTVMPSFYFNGTMHFFIQGEETENLPDLVTYNTTLGL